MSHQATFGPERVLARTIEAVNEAGPPAGVSDAGVTGALAQVLVRHGEPEPVRIPRSEAPAIKEVLARLYAVLQITDSEAAALGLNELLGRYGAVPRLDNDEGRTTWHLHVDPHDAEWADWLAASGAFALALSLATHGRPMWGACPAPGCGRVFVTQGPGRPRSACSTRCATRLRVAAYRRRRAAHAADPRDPSAKNPT